MSTPRQEARKGFTHPTRVALLEDDVDRLEGAVSSIDKNTSRILWALGTAAVTFAVSAVLLGIQIGAGV